MVQTDTAVRSTNEMLPQPGRGQEFVPPELPEILEHDALHAAELDPSGRMAVLAKIDHKGVVGTGLLCITDRYQLEVLQRREPGIDDLEEMVSSGRARLVTPPAGWSAAAITRKYGEPTRYVRVEKRSRTIQILIWTVTMSRYYQAIACIDELDS